MAHRCAPDDPGGHGAGAGETETATTEAIHSLLGLRALNERPRT